MRKKALLMALLMVLVGLFSSCNKKSGGGERLYDFNGRWLFTAQIQGSYGTWYMPAGQVTLIQNGNSLTWQWSDSSSPPLQGVCDPDSKTFAIDDTQSNGVQVVIQGHGVDEDTLQGSGRCTHERLWVEFTWTMELIGR